FGINRGLGRVEVFRPGLFVGYKRAPSESNNSPGLVGDREDDPITELGVNCRWSLVAARWLVFWDGIGCRLSVGLVALALLRAFFPGEQPTIAQDLLVEISL